MMLNSLALLDPPSRSLHILSFYAIFYSLPPIQAAPSPTLIQARRVHRARHDSWVIASRVVERAEDVFETCLWASKDVEEAQIRLRIARDEELACRRRVDDAALQILLIKRKDSTASNGGHPLQRRGTGVKNANADAESTLSPAEQPLKTPRTPKITIDFSSIATGMTEGGDGMVDGECRCQAPCLCSAVSSLFG